MRGSRRSLTGLAARAAMVPAAAFAVHQLRFLLAFGPRASVQLTATGHSYLHSLVPWIILLLGLSAGVFLLRLGHAVAGSQAAVTRSPSGRTLSFLALWLTSALCLVAIYAIQEFLEGLFLFGHPAGWEGIFGFGGWWAIPSAAGVGLVLACLFYGASWAIEKVIGRRRAPATAVPRIAPRFAPPGALHLVAPGPLVRGWCDRGPPVAC